MWIICPWTCGEEVLSPRLLKQQFSDCVTGYSPLLFPVGLEADTLQVDLFDLLEDGGGYVVGMFSYCSSVRCNLRVSTEPFDLRCSWVLTPDCQDSCWDTQVFNRIYNSWSLWHSACFTKKCFKSSQFYLYSSISQITICLEGLLPL